MAMKYQVQDCLKKFAEVCVVGNEYNSKRQHLCEAIVVKSFKAGSKASLSIFFQSPMETYVPHHYY